MSTKKIAVVAGAAGIIGRNLIQYLSEKRPDFEIIGLSRRAPDYASRQRHVAVDLLSVSDTENKLKDFQNVTHIFFAAYQEKPSLAEQIPPNLAMLKNLVEVVEKFSASTLQHICLAEGTKWYGPHLGPIKTPAKEDDPRQMPPNFYYDQEDYLSGRVRAGGVKWSWSGVRPNPVCGFALGNPMNIVMAIAVYGSICKELGLPLRYPGGPNAFDRLLECVDVEVLSAAMVFMSTSPQCANQAYNISNGDVFRWSGVWNAIAKNFGLKSQGDSGPICQISLAQMMSDKKPLWDSMVKKYGLQPLKFEELASWPFADWVFSREYDWFADMSKLRRAGFTAATVDTEEMFVRMLNDLRAKKIIP